MEEMRLGHAPVPCFILCISSICLAFPKENLQQCVKVLFENPRGPVCRLSHSTRGARDPLVCKKWAAAIFSINILGQALVFKWSAVKWV